MSLKALAAARRAALSASETAPETTMKQAKQRDGGGAPVFHEEPACFMPMKHENPQESAKNRPCFTVSPPKSGNDETSLLPADLLAGLDRLKRMRGPRLVRPKVWQEVVADALRLVEEGWAAKALALGWEPVHLWGCSPAIGGNLDHEGLAVVLAGRRIALLDEGAAIIESAAGTHRVFSIRPMAGAVLLWQLSSNAPRGDRNVVG